MSNTGPLMYDDAINKQVTQHLLSKVYEYYPVGAGEFRKTDYPGYQELLNIINHKFKIDIEDECSLGNLVSQDLNSISTELIFENRNYYDFPNYTYRASLGRTENNEFNTHLTLEICISLLVDYYSIYFEYYLQPRADLYKDASGYSIISFQNYQHNGNYAAWLQEITAIISRHFPSKKYVSHYLLYTNIISGMNPYGAGDSSDSSLFDFLFSNQKPSFSKLEILH